MTTRQRFSLILLLCAWGTGVAAPAGGNPFTHLQSEQTLLTAAEAFTPVSAVWRNGEVEIGIRVAPGYYLYRDSLELAAPQQVLSLPDGEDYHDEFFGDVVIYRDWISARFTAEKTPPTVTVRYQGCADIGVCYPPQTTTLSVAKARP